MRRGVAAAVLIAAAAVLAAACGGSGLRDDPRLMEWDNELTEAGQRHVGGTVEIPYETFEGGLPPYGGPHDGITLPCGAYQGAIREENAVHSMEHGAVIIWYRPSVVSEAEYGELKELTDEHVFERGNFVILAPLEGIGGAVALSSWGESMTLESVELDTIEAYIGEFKHDAPEPIEAGGCPELL